MSPRVVYDSPNKSNVEVPEEGDIILTPREAALLYHQLRKEWLNRDYYVELQAILVKLGIAADGVEI